MLNEARFGDMLRTFSTAPASIFYVTIIMMDFVLIIHVFLTGSGAAFMRLTWLANVT